MPGAGMTIGFIILAVLGAAAVGAFLYVANKSSKVQALVGGVFTSVFAFLGWLVTVPPNLQTGMLGELINIVPPDWQPAVGFWSKILAFGSGVYGFYKAAHSGPQTPPTNPPK